VAAEGVSEAEHGHGQHRSDQTEEQSVRQGNPRSPRMVFLPPVFCVKTIPTELA
jgi:hypothetical protein